MGERWRYYLAGLLHGVAVLLLLGWALARRPGAPPGAFGPRGALPVALVPGLVVFGVVLSVLAWRGDRAPPKP
jgi:hypothetical protein